MDLVLKRAELQGRANGFAVEEANLTEQIEKLRILEIRKVEVGRLKHQTLGAIAALDEVIKADENKSE